jgi:hypothetical protein
VVTKGGRMMNCTCEPANLDVFVCKDKGGPKASAQAVAMARAESEAAMAETADGARAAAAGRPAAARPNVVVFFVDDSGYGDTQVYGAPSTLTPNINRMAREGARRGSPSFSGRWAPVLVLDTLCDRKSICRKIISSQPRTGAQRCGRGAQVHVSRSGTPRTRSARPLGQRSW